MDLDKAPDDVLMDPEGVQKVLLNLMENAVKFTSKGRVALRVDTVAHDGELFRLRFSVTDTDIGISNELRERLFEPFEQGDSSMTRRYGGNGLGLAISKRIIERLKGEIGVQDNPEGGSTFWFELPVQSVSSEPSEDTQCK